ncbi:MAG: hypothetical protein ABH841_02925 [Candidatus Nealsonbacteria bacterium]
MRIFVKVKPAAEEEKMKINDLIKIKIKWWMAFLFFLLISSVIIFLEILLIK